MRTNPLLEIKNHYFLQEIPTDNFWWWANTLVTVLFGPLHVFIVGVLFFAYFDLDWTVYLWSFTQILLDVYSYLLLFGSVPL